MALPLETALRIVSRLVSEISHATDVASSTPLSHIGIFSVDQLDFLLARISRHLFEHGYHMSAGLVRSQITSDSTIDDVAHLLTSCAVTLSESDVATANRQDLVRPKVGEKGLGTHRIANDSAAVTEPAPPFFFVPIFFGTTRQRTSGPEFYGKERGALQYGLAIESVPSERRIGDTPRPSIWTLYREDPAKHYLLRKVEERTVGDFQADAKRHLASGNSKEAFVFVHGFNVTFVDAVHRTAQITADLNFDGTPILFTWPSKGQLSRRGYTMDETEAEWTVPYLAEFLRTITGIGAAKIHLIAHSMGNRVLTAALRRLREPACAFHELILTAPDIDTDTFVKDIAPAIIPAANRVTLYASSKDVALAYSKRIHGYPRLGDSDDNLVTLDSVDTIDVSAVDTNLIGHFYYGDNRSVLSDLFNLIKGQPVPRFGLRESKKGSRRYWVFQP